MDWTGMWHCCDQPHNSFVGSYTSEGSKEGREVELVSSGWKEYESYRNSSSCAYHKWGNYFLKFFYQSIREQPSSLCFHYIHFGWFMYLTMQVTYMCGGCGQQNGIKPQDTIRCRTCGYRILYKIRTKRCKYTPNEELIFLLLLLLLLLYFLITMSFILCF